VARESARPARCISFTATWSTGADCPRAFCVARRGVWVNGLLYPLLPGVFALAVA
jgi:hypothetical protein